MACQSVSVRSLGRASVQSYPYDLRSVERGAWSVERGAGGLRRVGGLSPGPVTDVLCWTAGLGSMRQGLLLSVRALKVDRGTCLDGIPGTQQVNTCSTSTLITITITILPSPTPSEDLRWFIYIYIYTHTNINASFRRASHSTDHGSKCSGTTRKCPGVPRYRVNEQYMFRIVNVPATGGPCHCTL
jgi:hypothetical protein